MRVAAQTGDAPCSYNLPGTRQDDRFLLASRRQGGRHSPSGDQACRNCASESQCRSMASLPAPCRAWRPLASVACVCTSGCSRWRYPQDARIGWRRGQCQHAGRRGIAGHIGATIMGRNMFGGHPGPGMRRTHGTAGGETIRRSTTRCSCSRTIRVKRWNWRAGRPSPSSPAASKRRSNKPGKPPPARTWRSAAARMPPSSTSQRPRGRDGTSLVPILLGSGERLFEGIGGDMHGLELVRTVAAPDVVHLKFMRR